MAVQALGWLSSKLGVNIDGRTKEPDNSMMSALGSTMFGGDASDTGVRRDADGHAIDENGLPVGRDWYYYDEQLGRFNVRPDAPAHIRDEHARQVAAMEAEKNGSVSKEPIPPPPPPPPAIAAAALQGRSPASPQYADAGYFGGQ